MIEHTRRLNEQLVIWKERNRSLIAGSTGTNRGERGGGGSKGDGEGGGGSKSVFLAVLLPRYNSRVVQNGGMS